MEEGLTTSGSRQPVAAVVSIGDELTSGQRLDTNTQWLSNQLIELGIATTLQLTVGDDQPAIVRALRFAAEFSDVVAVTGGLGPTADDLTRDALAELAGVALENDPQSLSAIEQRFVRRGRNMPLNNRRQAMFPAGSQVIPNPLGTAPGIALSLARPGRPPCHFFALPGVPAEMRPMWHNAVSRRIQSLFPQRGTIEIRTLHCFGAGESEVEMRLPDMIRRGHHPETGITASGGIITLRIVAHGADRDECRRQIAGAEKVIRDSLGELVFGDSGMTLEGAVIGLLRSAGNAAVAVAERGTDGWLTRLLSTADPTGEVFRAGVCRSTGADPFHESDLVELRRQLAVDYVLLADVPGSDSSDDQALCRIGYLDSIGFRGREVPAITDSTITRPYAARQALDFLRRHLSQPAESPRQIHV